MSWVSALKEWNAGKGTWCIPKKGTDAHAEVLAIIQRQKTTPPPAPPPAPAKRKSFAALNQTPAQLAAEDERVADLRKYLAQRKAFSRLKDPIREKLAEYNREVTRIRDADSEIQNQRYQLAKRLGKSEAYKNAMAQGKFKEYGTTPTGDPIMFEEIQQQPGPLYDAIRRTKIGKEIVAHILTHPTEYDMLPQYRRNVAKGRDYKGPLPKEGYISTFRYLKEPGIG